jgi:hypothetical protein
MMRPNRALAVASLALALAWSAAGLRAEAPRPTLGTSGERPQALQYGKPSADDKKQDAKQREVEKKREAKQREADKKQEAAEAKRTQPKTFDFPEHGFKYTSVAGWMPIEARGPNLVHGLLFRPAPRKATPAPPGAAPSTPTRSSTFMVFVRPLADGQTVDELAKVFEGELNCHNTFDVQPSETTTIDGVDARLVAFVPKPDNKTNGTQRCLIGTNDGRGYIFHLMAAPDAPDAVVAGATKMDASIKWLSKDAATKPSH